MVAYFLFHMKPIFYLNTHLCETLIAGREFELRAGKSASVSDSEVSYIKMCPDPPPQALRSVTEQPVEGLTIRKRESHDEVDKKGGWSNGNAEGSAAMIIVHNEDPLPPFYDPTNDGFTGQGRNDMGSFIDGLPTIYLKVASYRDELCHLTLADAFTKANHPERIFIGIVEQVCVDTRSFLILIFFSLILSNSCILSLSSILSNSSFLFLKEFYRGHCLHGG